MKVNIVFFLLIFIFTNSIFAQHMTQKKSIQHHHNKETTIHKDQQAIKKAINLFKAERLDEAAEFLRRILHKSPQKNWPKAMLSFIEFKKNNPEAARKLAAEAVKKNNKSVLAHLVLAGLAKQKGYDLAAADHLRKAKRFANKPFEKEMIARLTNEYKVSEKPKLKFETINQVITDDNSVLPYIAVFPFAGSDDNSTSENLNASVSEMMVTALIQTNRFKVIERTQLDKIIEEQALGQSGVLEDQTALEIGNILGVNAIVIGSVSSLNSIIELDSRLLNAESGEAITAASGTARQEEQIRSAVNQMANSLAKYADKISSTRTKQESKVEEGLRN